VRILCIDDEPMILGAIARALSGHEIVCYNDSCAAIGHLVKEPHVGYDVVVCDVLMPECSGVDIHRIVRRDRPELLKRMIFITGATMMPAIESFLDSTGSPVLRKPFGTDDIVFACTEVSGVDPRSRRV
jgi:CheY-like chemotaxis protein